MKIFSTIIFKSVRFSPAAFKWRDLHRIFRDRAICACHGCVPSLRAQLIYQRDRVLAYFRREVR